MTDFKAKMHQIRFRLGLRPRPHWGSLHRSATPPSWIWGVTSRQGEGLSWVRGGNGREGEVEGREREGPQVTVEPGPLRALLRHCRDYWYLGNAAENLRSNAATSVLRRHVDILQVDCSTYERRVGPVVHAVCHQLPTSMTHSSSYQLTALTHYCYHTLLRGVYRGAVGSQLCLSHNHCDLQPWARAVCTLPAVTRSTQPSTIRGTVNEYHFSG